VKDLKKEARTVFQTQTTRPGRKAPSTNHLKRLDIRFNNH